MQSTPSSWSFPPWLAFSVIIHSDKQCDRGTSSRRLAARIASTQEEGMEEKNCRCSQCLCPSHFPIGLYCQSSSSLKSPVTEASLQGLFSCSTKAHRKKAWKRRAVGAVNAIVLVISAILSHLQHGLCHQASSP